MTTRRAKRPLDRSAVKKANQAVHDLTTPPGRRLHPTSANDRKLRKIWMDAYLEAAANDDEVEPIPALITPVAPCPAPPPDRCSEGRAEKTAERKKRYRERKELIANAKGNDKLEAAVERLTFNNDNIIRAEAAQHVYPVDEANRGKRKKDDVPCPPIGLKLIDPKTVPGLENATFTDKESGFGAALYQSEITGETMLVYRGTNNGVTTIEDWKTNLGQGLGLETTQYSQAMKLARQVKAATGGTNTIVGHSLGGGLASSGVAATGQNGYTFNSAGLHPKTAARLSGDSGLSNEKTASLIKTTAVDGEILTGVQKHKWKFLPAIGFKLGGLLGAGIGALLASYVMPEAAGEMHSIPSISGGDPVKRHLMPQVIEGIEFQKKEDIATLKAGLE